MLVCRLEHSPGGEDAKRRDMGQLHVQKVGGDDDQADYAALLYRPDGTVADTAEIRDFPIRQAGAWALVGRALDLLVGPQWKFPPLAKGEAKRWRQ